MSLDCVLGIDPGPVHSGVVLLYGDMVVEGAVMENGEIRDKLYNGWEHAVAIEMIASYGMPVGSEVFETCVEIGRMIQCAQNARVYRIYRKEVTQHICGTAKGKDANVRQALLDMFPRYGGGKCPQIGTKKQPGPLFGFNSHMWPALGVAITARDTK